MSGSTKARQMFDLAGRVAIVTGESVELGRQMAEGFAEMGANLVLRARCSPPSLWAGLAGRMI
ncbi:MAG: hypothetical protein WA192_10965 [Candidatus Acidiferrales bacterium]